MPSDSSRSSKFVGSWTDLSSLQQEQLEQIIDRFEDAWQRGDRPDIASYLPDANPLRLAVLREIVRVDFEYRYLANESPEPAKYLDRFPELAGDERFVLTLVRPSKPNSGSPLLAGASVLQALGASLMGMPQIVLREVDQETVVPHLLPESINAPSRHETTGRLKLHGEIARGGMGAVLKGRDTDLGRDVAVKVLLETHQGKTELLQRFVEEAQIHGQLQHPGVAPVYEMGQFRDKRPYFTMKLVKGETLAKLLAERQKTSNDRTHFLGLFEQVCQTLAYAHARGVIHRDLKPANIMVGAFGEVQVMDWGLAKVLATQDSNPPQSSVATPDISVIRTIRNEGSDIPGSHGTQTLAGSVLGTPAYMPPEQALGEIEKLDERADVFGLGAILCEILTRRPPYVGNDASAVWRKATRGDLVEAFQCLDNCGADADLITIAKRSLAVEPEDRPRHAGELVTALKAYLTGVEEKLRVAELQRVEAQARAEEEAKQRLLADQLMEAAQGQAQSERNRRQVTLALAVSVLFIVLGGSGAAIWMRQRETAVKRDKIVRLEEFNRQLDDKRAEAEIQREEAIAAKSHAESHAAQAEDAKYRANKQRQRAEHETMLAKSLALAAQSQQAKDSQNDRALLLAAAAVEVTTLHGEPVTAAAMQALRDALSTVGGEPLAGRDWRATTTTVSPGGHWLSALCSDGKLRLWNLLGDVNLNAAFEFEDLIQNADPVAFSPDQRWFITAHRNGELRLWDLAASEFSKPVKSFRTGGGEQQSISRILVSPDSRIVVAESTYQTEFKEENGSTGFRFGGTMIHRWELNPSGSEQPAIISNIPNVFGGELKFNANSQQLYLSSPHSQIGNRGDRPAICVLDTTSLDPDPRVIHVPIPGHFIPHAQISSNGRWLAAKGEKDQVLLWDLAASNPDTSLKSLTASDRGNFIQTLLISPDSRWLVAGTWSDPIRLWDLEADNPAAAQIILQDVPATFPIAIGSESRWLLLSGVDVAVFWDLKEGNVSNAATIVGKAIANRHDYAIEASARSSDGRWFAALTFDVQTNATSIRLWDLNSDQPPRRDDVPLAVLTGSFNAIISNAIAFSHDARYLVLRMPDRKIRRWDLSASGPVSAPVILNSHADGPHNQIVIGGEGRYAVEVGRIFSFFLSGNDTDRNSRPSFVNWRIVPRIWDCKDPLSNSESSIVQMASKSFRISADEKWLLSDRSLWQLQGGHPSGSPRLLSIGTEGLHWLEFSPDSRWIVGPGTENTYVWDLTNEVPEKAPFRIPAGATKVYPQQAFSQDGRFWALSLDGKVLVSDLTSAESIATPTVLIGHKGNVSHVTVSNDGKWVLTASQAGFREHTVRLWPTSRDSSPIDPIWIHIQPPNFTGIAISGNNQWIVTGTLNQTNLWRMSGDGDVTGPIVLEGDVLRFLVSHDSRWLVIIGSASARIFDLEAPDPSASPINLSTVHELLGQAAWSTDDRWLAAIGRDQTILLWDLESLRNAADSTKKNGPRFLSSIVLRGHDGNCLDLRFSRDGRHLVSAGTDGTLQFHRLSPPELVEAARLAAGREFTAFERGRFQIEKADETPQTKGFIKPAEDVQFQSWEEALDSVVDVDWSRAPLVDFVDQCAAIFHLPLVIDHEGLKRAGVSYDVHVGLSQKNVSLRTVLEVMLEPLKLGFEIRGERLVISQGTSEQHIGKALSDARKKKRGDLDQILDRNVPLDCLDMSIQDCLSYFSDYVGKPIFLIDSVATSAISQASNPNVTLKTPGAPLRELLQVMLKPLNLRMVLHDDLVRITTVERGNAPMVLKSNPQDKELLAKEIERLRRIREMETRPLSPQENLLERIDVERDSVSGIWQKGEGTLKSPKFYGARIELPVANPEEYEFSVVAEPLDEPNGLILGQNMAGRRFQVVIHFIAGEPTSVIESIDGKDIYHENPTIHRGAVLEKGRPSKIVCSVRKGHVEVVCDGKSILDWEGDPQSLGMINDYWKTPNDKFLYLGSYDCRFRFDKVTLRSLDDKVSSDQEKSR